MSSPAPERRPKLCASTKMLFAVVITPLPSGRPPSHTTEACRFIINPRIGAGFVSGQYLVAGMPIALYYGTTFDGLPRPNRPPPHPHRPAWLRQIGLDISGEKGNSGWRTQSRALWNCGTCDILLLSPRR